ncbi:MAG TPA: hypothetical protein PKZ32_01245 [Candidatus Melainabacteria bacterium]|nr:hypothetical protein [Candidatus Melainabacteria bacterium]
MDSAKQSVKTDDSMGSAFEDFFHSAAYSAFEAPINSLGKLTKEITGSRLLPEIDLFGAPEQAQFGSKRWHAQQAGSAVGMIVPFMLTREGMKCAGIGRTSPALARSLSVGERASLIGQSAASGAVFSTLFQDADGTGLDYWANKGKNLAVTSVAFGSFTGFSGTSGSALRTALAGAGAGSMAADTHSLIEGRGLASLGERYQSAYSYAFTGLALKGGESLMARARSQSIPDALQRIKNPELREMHDLSTYSKAFDGFGGRVKKTMGGADSVVLELTDGRILKMTTKQLPEEVGTRAFDQPILERGSRTADGITINYFVQPKAEPARPGDLDLVNKVVKEHGYIFRDPALQQIGRYQGEPKLLDPFAVIKNK